MDKQGSRRGYTGRMLRVRSHNMESVFASKERKHTNLRGVTAVKDIHTGRSSEFEVTIREGFGQGAGKTIHYRAPCDADKQRWMMLFRLYSQMSHVSSALQTLPPRARAQLLTHTVHKPVARVGYVFYYVHVVFVVVVSQMCVT